MIKDKILQSFLKISSTSEISVDILTKVADDCSIEEARVLMEFENGVVDIVSYYQEGKILQLEKLVAQKSDFSKLKIREKIEFCVHNFFLLQRKDQSSIRAIKNYYFDLGNLINKDRGITPISFAIKSSYEISDRIWCILSDKSTDINYYTKRLMLSKLLSCTFFAFLKDDSEGLDITRSSVRNQIDQIMKIQKLKSDFSNLSELSREELSRLFLNQDNNKMKPVADIIKSL